ncbi:MAG: DNA mismatch repair protein MutS, partial [Thermoanaerobaculia bacterium]
MKLTPMLEQYFEIKRQVPDAILFYRLGDFYEMFYEDAEKAAPILDLVLTARGRGQEHEAPMCGVPYHAAEGYIAKLIKNGFRVALCEQVEDPAAAKGLVRREIVRMITPGTATESAIVERENCYLLALSAGEGAGAPLGAAYLDVSTGDFFVTTYRSLDDARLADDIVRLGAREAVMPREAVGYEGRIRDRGITATPIEDSMFEVRGAGDYLTRHFKTQSLRGFGLEPDDVRVSAAGAALRYAAASHKKTLDHVRSLRVDNDGDYLQLDAATLANLEILESRDAGRPRASLWSVVDATRTAVGGRTLRNWITRPLKDRDAIFARHDAVDELTRTRTVLEAMSQRLARIADLERLTSRITLRSASPRECLTLGDSMLAVDELREIMRPLKGPLLSRLRDALDPVPDAVARIAATVDDTPPPNIREGGVIRSGVDPELDSLRSIAHDSKSVLMDIEAREKQRTGISSLKVRFNSVFGYYIEVSKSNLARVPPEYIRKQTLVNAERFITPDLKVLEEKIVGAEEKATAIELRLYEELLAAL